MGGITVANRYATSPPSGGEVARGWYQGRKAGILRERVSVTNDSLQALLTKKIPPRCKGVVAFVRQQTAVAVDGTDATSTADCYGLFNLGTATALSTATASNATASAIITVASAATSLAADNVTPNFAGGVATAAFINTTTNENYLALIPMATSSNRIFPKTDGFLFNGTAEVDVVLYIEEFSVHGA
jgi:hypothetical protein